jgi:single-strand DNA-binding protein
MLNKVVLIGRLTKDPELRYTATGTAVCTFTLAVDRQKKDEADFIPIVTWKKIAESCGKYLVKGRLVAVCGRIQVRNYENKEGKRRYVTEVIGDEVKFLSWKQETEADMTGFEPVPPEPKQQSMDTFEGEKPDLPF